MKKLLCVTIFFIISLCVFLSLLIEKQIDSNHWNTFYQKESYQLTINPLADYDKDTYYQTLINLVEKYEANIFSSKQENDTTIICTYLSPTMDTSSINSNFFITPDNTKENIFISTTNTGMNNQIGLIKDLFNDNKVEIGTFYYGYLNNYISGYFTLKLKDSNQLPNFIKDLATEINIEENSIQQMNLQQNDPLLNLYKSIMIVLIVALTLVLFYYTTFQAKRMGVYKLNGYRDKDIYFKFMYPIFMTLGLASIFCIIIIFISVDNPNTLFWQHIIIDMIGIIVWSLIATLAVYFTIRQFSLINILKGHYGRKLIENINLGLKVIILCYCFYLCGIIFANLSRAYAFRENMDSWIKYKDYGIFENFKGNEVSYYISNKEQDDFFNIYEELSKENIYYIQSSTVDSIFFKNYQDKESANRITPFTYMNINDNYLNNLMLLDINSNQIILDSSSNQRLILIPKSKSIMQDYETLMNLYLSQYTDVQTNTIIYDDSLNNQFFSFSLQHNEDQKYNIYSPIFTVFNNNTIGDLEISNMKTTRGNATIKIPLQGNTIEDVEKVVNQIFNKYTNGNLQVKLCTQIYPFEDEIDFTYHIINSYLPILIILIIIYSIVITLSLKLYIKNNIKIIGIKRLNGFSLIHSLKAYIIKMIVIDCFCAIGYFIGVQNFISSIGMDNFRMIHGNGLTYTLFVVLILIDIGFLIINIKINEKKTVAKMLKGD